MLTQDGDLASELAHSQIGLGRLLGQLEIELRLAIALQDSRAFRLRVLEGRPLLFVSLPLDAGWLHIEPDRSSRSRVRLALATDAPTRPLVDLLNDAALEAASATRPVLEAAITKERALVMSLLDDDRRNYVLLSRWAAVVESTAYAVAAQLTIVLDRMRSEVGAALAQSRPEAAELASNYRRLVHLLGRVTLLATDDRSAWLPEMAAVFKWIRWTPSFPLSRGRDRWSTLIGARAASRFGPPVIDRYCAIPTHARHPVNALDALIGLVAIGLRHPSERTLFTRPLEDDAAQVKDRHDFFADIVARGYADALSVLRGNATASLASLSRREDGFEIDRTGGLPIFFMIADPIETPAWKFIPVDARPMLPQAAQELFVRAWGSGKIDLDNLPDWAFGRA